MSNVQKTLDAVIVTGEYTDNQGNQKKSYMTIGRLFVYNDGGMSLKLDAAPIGNGNISFYEKKPKQQQGQGGGYQQAPQRNNDNPSRHNIAGDMNKPAGNYQQQETYYDANGQPLPL